jgi:hypothetical protein
MDELEAKMWFLIGKYEGTLQLVRKMHIMRDDPEYIKRHLSMIEEEIARAGQTAAWVRLLGEGNASKPVYKDARLRPW